MHNTTIWLQFSSGQGPAECEWVVGRLARLFLAEAQKSGCRCSILDQVRAKNRPEEPDDERGALFRSILLDVQGGAAETLCRDWQGTLLWQGQSPFRPNHRRKNWFVSASIIPCPPRIALMDLEKQVTFSAFRAGGAGGQHVNKTSSAVRLLHRPTGLTVEAQEERSQHRNRQIALKRLAVLLDRENRRAEESAHQDRRMQHYRLERGNPRRIFSGIRFDAR